MIHEIAQEYLDHEFDHESEVSHALDSYCDSDHKCEKKFTFTLADFLCLFI